MVPKSINTPQAPLSFTPCILGPLGADSLSVLLEPQVEWCPQHSLGASWVGPPAQSLFLVAHSSSVKKKKPWGWGRVPLRRPSHVPLHTAHHHFAHCLFTLHVSKAEKMEIKCIYTVIRDAE